MADEDEVRRKRLGKSLAGYKATLTRRINQATQLIASAQTDQSSHNARLLEQIMDKILGDIDSIEAAGGLYMPELDDAAEQTAQADINRVINLGADKIKEVSAALKVLTAPALPLLAAPAPTPATDKVKPNETLKPETLLSSFTPVELRTWIHSYRAYHTASRFDKASVPEQQAYFIRVLDSHLAEHVRSKKNENTPIYEDPGDTSIVSCIKIIQDFFLLKYPLTLRRFEFFSYKQEPGKSFLDFKVALEAKANEADLHKLTPEDMKVFRLIAGTTNTKLQNKFLTMKDEPTLDLLEKIAHAQEASVHTMKGMGSSTEAVCKVYGKGNRFNSQRSGTPGPHQKQCLRCGEHPAGEKCSFPNIKKVKCHNCGKEGHLQKVCLSKRQDNQHRGRWKVH